MSLIRLLYLVAGVATAACAIYNYNGTPAAGIAYPQPLPDTVPTSFLPGVVSTDSLDFNAAFSPDGKSFYFTRSIQKRSVIYVTHYVDGRWTEAADAGLSLPGCSDADPAFAPDGRLCFISDRPGNERDTLRDYDIWYTSPAGNGTWSAPRRLDVLNSDSSEYYISFARNGNVYFASSRKGGYGGEDIYLSRLIDNHYTEPVNLGPTINTARSEYDPCISGSEDVMIFTSSNRADSYGKGDLYASRQNDNTWSPASNLGNAFNTTSREYCAYFSPDNAWFFFSSQKDVKWVRADFVTEHIKNLTTTTE